MKYAALFIGDVEGNNQTFAGIIILPNESYKRGTEVLPYCFDKNEVVLTKEGIRFCRDNYGARHNWEPGFYNYKLVLKTKAEVAEYVERRRKDIEAIYAEIEYLTTTYAMIEDDYSETKK